MMQSPVENPQQISVPFINIVASDLDDIVRYFSDAVKYPLAFAPWQEAFPYRPKVQFAIAYNESSIALQFTVTEKVVQAAHGIINGPVYQDSCVEAFISLDAGNTYYNFEFNCLGTVLAGYGSGRAAREWLPETILHQICTHSSIIKSGGQGLVNWQLTVVIPFSVFLYHPQASFQGKQHKANFYKCGDHLPEPHFLCWSEIQSSEPDFHLPQYFGTLLFQ